MTWRIDLPLAHFGARLIQDPVTNRNDQSSLLSDRNKVSRRYQTTSRMIPPNEGFETCQTSGCERDYRLVINAEFLLFDSLSQVAFQLQPRNCASVHAVIENFV